MNETTVQTKQDTPKVNIATAPSQTIQEKPVQEAPKESPKTEQVERPTVSSSDILKRASEVKPKEEKKDTNYREDLEKITDPTVRAIAEKQLKDLESGYNKKFQDLAQQRKDIEAMQAKISTWTPQRLQEELKNPAFLQAMQLLQQQAPPQEWEGTQEEWAGLSPSERQKIEQMRQEQQSLQAQLNQMRQKEEDVEIKKLYPDYEPQIVEEAIDGLRSGKIQASRVDIWKVINHDKNVEKGYQFGYEDGYKKAMEKLNANSIPQNGNVTSADEVPEEVRKGGFSSIAMWRLQRSKNGSKK